MLGSASLMAFVPTRNPEQARPFYEDVLGLRFIADEPYALVFDSAGTLLRVAKVDSFTPAPFTVAGWVVDDIATTVAGLRGRGVAFERYPFLEQDEDGIWASPGGAQIAWFKDPDGNTLSLAAGVR